MTSFFRKGSGTTKADLMTCLNRSAPFKIIFGGPLAKKGQFNKGWKKRYFALVEPNVLVYFSNRSKCQDLVDLVRKERLAHDKSRLDAVISSAAKLVNGTIPIYGTTAVLRKGSYEKRPYVFTVQAGKSERTFFLAADDSKELNEWLNIIQQVRNADVRKGAPALESKSDVRGKSASGVQQQFSSAGGGGGAAGGVSSGRHDAQETSLKRLIVATERLLMRGVQDVHVLLGNDGDGQHSEQDEAPTVQFQFDWPDVRPSPEETEGKQAEEGSGPGQSSAPSEGEQTGSDQRTPAPSIPSVLRPNTVRVVQFGFTVEGVGSKCRFSQGLETFHEFLLSWERLPAPQALAVLRGHPEACRRLQVAVPDEGKTEGTSQLPGVFRMRVGDYVEHEKDGNMRELPECPAQSFLVLADGRFLALENAAPLETQVWELIVQQDRSLQNASPEARAHSLRLLQELCGGAVHSAILSDVQLMWAAFVQAWVGQKEKASVVAGQASVSERRNPHFQAALNSFGVQVANMNRSIKSKGGSALKLAERLLSSGHKYVGRAHTDENGKTKQQKPDKTPNMFHSVVVNQKVVFEGLMEPSCTRPHICGYRKSTDSCVVLEPFKSRSACIAAKRWVFLWPDLPGMAVPEHILHEWRQYVQLANAIYNHLSSHGANNGQSGAARSKGKASS